MAVLWRVARLGRHDLPRLKYLLSEIESLQCLQMSLNLRCARIAVQFGTEWQHYRVVVDDVEFMFSCYHGESDYRLDEISLYTNPKLWARAEIVVPATVARDAFFEFAIAEEELDVISLRAELEVACDVERRRILFEFAPGEPEAAWTRIADGALISQTRAGQLKSILFEEVEL